MRNEERTHEGERGERKLILGHKGSNRCHRVHEKKNPRLVNKKIEDGQG